MIGLTGASGFVGKAVQIVARQRNIPIRIVSRVELGELGSGVISPKCFETCSAVIHLAAHAHQSGSASDQYQRVNVEGTRAVLQACLAAGVKSFIFCSSIKAVAESERFGRPIRFSDEQFPEDDYGRSKAAAEHLVVSESAMRSCIIRPPLVVGTGVKGNILQLLHAINLGAPLPLGGTACVQRSVIDKLDLASLLLTAAVDASYCGVIHAAHRVPISPLGMVHSLAAGMGKRARLFTMSRRVMDVFPHGRERSQRLYGDLRVQPGGNVELGWRANIEPVASFVACGAAFARAMGELE